MHEMSVMGEIFSIIYIKVHKYNLSKITCVTIRIGEMTCLSEQSLRFAFDVFAENTIAEGADFVINKVKARAKCSNCSKIFEIIYTDKECPNCHIYSDNIFSGYELYLDKVEGEGNEKY